MEQKPHDREGDEQQPDEAPAALETGGRPHGATLEYGYLSPIPPEGDSWDEWIIEQGIAAALREGRNIDDRTAHYIATQLHEGQHSALYTLATTGEIDEVRVYVDLRRRAQQVPEQLQHWVRWLNGYCSLRLDPGPVADWTESIARQDQADMEALRTSEYEDDPDSIDTLFGRQPEEVLGSVDKLGWFGLVRHEDRPGGLILSQDEQGFRRVWETDADAELESRWGQITAEYQDYYQQVESQETSLRRRVVDQADLEERLAPLPDLGDIPRPRWGHRFGSGYEWMQEGLPPGWHPEPVWGRSGWDLGAWPLVAVALYIEEGRGQYAVATYVEGDVDVKRYKSRGALYVAVNKIAEFYWRSGAAQGPNDLPEGEGLLAHHTGPYSGLSHAHEAGNAAPRDEE